MEAHMDRGASGRRSRGDFWFYLIAHHSCGNVTDWSIRWTVKIKEMTNKRAAYTATLGDNPPLSTPQTLFWGAATDEHPQTPSDPDCQRDGTQPVHVQQVSAPTHGRTSVHLHLQTRGCSSAVGTPPLSTHTFDLKRGFFSNRNFLFFTFFFCSSWITQVVLWCWNWNDGGSPFKDSHDALLFPKWVVWRWNWWQKR